MPRSQGGEQDRERRRDVDADVLKGSSPKQIHSWTSPKCGLAHSARHGAGLWCSAPIAAGELVMIWGGRLYSTEEKNRLASAHSRMATHTVGVAPGLFLGPFQPSDLDASLDTAELLNHSCQPNLGVQGQVVLVARRAIAVGEELTYDYETTDTEGMWFECRCGVPECRGIIDGQSWKRPEWRQANAGYLSWNVLETVRRAGV